MAVAGGPGLIRLEIIPSDGTTTVTVTVTGPDGTELHPTPVSTDGGATWSAYPTYTVSGKWIALWEVDGTGEGIAPQEIWVARMPTPGEAAAWRPGLEDVAAYVPNRTLVGAVTGYGDPIHLFDDTTQPPGPVVQRLITDACAWVLAATGDLDESLGAAAAGVASRRSAGWVEYSYFDSENDKQHAERLLKEAEAELKALVSRNTDLTGEDPAPTPDDVLPDVWWPTVADTWNC